MKQIWTLWMLQLKRETPASCMKVQMLYNVANTPSLPYVLSKISALKQVFLDFMCFSI